MQAGHIPCLSHDLEHFPLHPFDKDGGITAAYFDAADFDLVAFIPAHVPVCRRDVRIHLRGREEKPGVRPFQ